MKPLAPLLALLPAGLAATARPQETPPAAVGAAVRVEEGCRAVLAELLERGVPGASAALVLPDGAVLSLTAGLASKDDGTPMEPDARMLSGSVGKTYVTAAAHHLAQAGKLDLDRRAASYFGDGEPAWPAWIGRLPNAREVTLRQLLQHRSGIPRYVFAPAFAADLTSEPDRTWEPEERLAYVFDAEPLFAPGEGWAYSDTNYVVVGMVLERAAGEPFYAYARRHLLAPHGLEDTVPSDRRGVPGVVQGHVVLGREFGLPERALEDGVFVFNPQFEWCGGGWASTAADLARWARILFSGRAFEGDYLASLLEAVEAPELGPGVRYGLGAMLRESAIGPLVGHDGFMPGYLATMGFFPELELAAALQLNTDDAAALGRPAADWLAELARVARDELGL